MSELLGKKVKLFSLSANQPLALEIAKSIGIELAKCEVVHFADGEINVNINETVRGHDVFVVQPTSSPVNEHLMELLIMCDALKRASAKTINLIIPYYGYSRQDRKARSRQPITAKLVADLLQTAGANRVIAMDLHAAQIQGFFNIPIDNFLGLPILVNYFIDNHLSGKDTIIVSPDHGGVVRAREFAKILECPIAIIDKRRPEPNKAEVMNILGDVANKTCIIVDDMVAKVKIQIESSPVPHREKKEESVVHVQHVNPQIKGFWTREEDELLKKAVESTNPIVWDIVAEQVPGRSPIQCRERWRNRLDPAVKKTRFERWEDNIIIREQKKEVCQQYAFSGKKQKRTEGGGNSAP